MHHFCGCRAVLEGDMQPLGCPKISSARQAHNTRYETRADMVIMGRRMSAYADGTVAHKLR